MAQTTMAFDRVWQHGARDFLLSLSLANLVYYPVWSHLVDLPHPYFGKEAAPAVAFAAAWFSVLVLALAMTGVRLLKGVSGNARPRLDPRWITVIAWLLPLSFLVHDVGESIGSPPWFMKGAPWVLAFALFVLCLRIPSRMLSAAEIAALIFAPFLLVTAGQSLWWLSGGGRTEPLPPTLATAKAPPSGSENRVVWIVMDEFDYRLAFEARPPGLSLPALDRLRGEAFFASQALPPAWRTLLSLPAMINGERVVAAEPISSSELGIYFENSDEAVPWSETRNLFTLARERQLNSSIVGFYHPYCELFSELVSECIVADFFTGWDERSFGETLGDQGSELIARTPVLAAVWNTLGLPQWGKGRKVIFLKETLLELHETLMRGAQETLARRDLQLQLIHLAVPHPPGIYDRGEDTISLESHTNYIDNLELADRVFAEIRADAEAAGTWEDTTWILTSDHWWKSEFWKTEPGWTEEEQRLATGETDPRVPFFLKIAGEHDAVEYPAPLEIVIIPRLIEALWDGRIHTHRELYRWLAPPGSRDASSLPRRSTPPSPSGR